MPRQFIQDPNGPRGMGRVIDTDLGIDRVVYDPTLAPSPTGSGDPQQGTFTPEPGFSAEQEAALQESAPAPAAPQLAPAPTEAEQASALLPGLAPPPVAPGRAMQWQAAQMPLPEAAIRSTGAPPPPPMAPAGTVLQKAKLEQGQPGYAYDQAAEDERNAELAERTAEQQRRQEAVDLVKGEQQVELETQRNEAKRMAAIEAERSTRYERELNETVKKEINQDRLQENQGLFGSLLGLVGQTLGYLSTPDSGFGRLQSALDRRVQRDIEAQREAKGSAINNLTRQLGSAQQAESHYRAQINATTADLIETRLQRLGIADQYADRIQELRDTALAYNQAAKAASYGKPGKAEYEFQRPEPLKGGKPKIALNNPTTQRLEKIGITPDGWTKGLDGKVSAQQNAPTIAQAAVTTKQIDSDINLLESIAAANGGKLPTKGTFNIPESLVPKLSQMGIEAGMEAEQVYQILDGYVNQQARSYGGAITDSDRESAKRETGTSTEGLRFYLKRLRDRNNNGIRTALSQQFPGAGQQAFDVLLEDSSSNAGVPSAEAKPFERTNGPAPSAKKAEPEKRSGTAEQQARNREEARKKASDWFSNLSPVRPPRYGGAK